MGSCKNKHSSGVERRQLAHDLGALGLRGGLCWGPGRAVSLWGRGAGSQGGHPEESLRSSL